MRSLYSRLAVWAIATSVVCLGGIFLTDSLRSFSHSRADFLSKFLEFQVASARQAYAEDGRNGLRQFFIQLQSHFPGSYALLDENGRDLLTGENRRADLRNTRPPLLWRSGRDKVEIIWPTADYKYYLAAEAVFPSGPPPSVPFYFWLLVAGLGFCYIPAFKIASPLRSLSYTVEQFGCGELGARVNHLGQDEIGKLGRAFNLMADRLETLLTAERRLLTDVSHELRSPLARLKFAVQLARTSPDRQGSLDRIERDVDRLTVLVSELLNVTRAEAETQHHNWPEISLNEILKTAVEASTLEASARKCHLHLDAPEPVYLPGDNELLYRATENILRNAIRYAPEGTGIEIGLLRHSDAEVVISIRDYGPGVPDHTVNSLFRPFFRVEADRNRMDGAGFGLGLSIAQRAIAVHGGQITAANQKPGLLIKLTLPLHHKKSRSSENALEQAPMLRG